MSYLNTREVAVATSDTLLSAPQSRNYVGIQNHDADNFVVIKFNNAESLDTPATLTNGVKLLAGEFYQIQAAGISGEIRAIADTGAVNVVINEGT